MYRGKHELPARGIKKYKKSGVLLASLVLIFILTIGTTLAYLIDSTDPVENVFNPSKVTVTVNEEFDKTTKLDVGAHNSSDIPVYVRMTLVEYWTKDGVIVPAPTNGSVNIVWDENKADNWIDNNGIYYYKSPLAVGGNTPNLIDSVTATRPEGYIYHMDVLAEAIQAEPSSVVVNEWGVILGGDDGKTITGFRTN